MKKTKLIAEALPIVPEYLELLNSLREKYDIPLLWGFKSEKKIWPCLHEEMVKVMMQLRNAFDPHLAELID